MSYLHDDRLVGGVHAIVGSSLRSAPTTAESTPLGRDCQGNRKRCISYAQVSCAGRSHSHQWHFVRVFTTVIDEPEVSGMTACLTETGRSFPSLFSLGNHRASSLKSTASDRNPHRIEFPALFRFRIAVCPDPVIYKPGRWKRRCLIGGQRACPLDLM